MRDHADCRVRVLPSVDPSPFNGDVAALREHVRQLIVEGVAQLDREKRADGVGTSRDESAGSAPPPPESVPPPPPEHAARPSAQSEPR